MIGLATRSTGVDASGQSSRKLSEDEKTKLFWEDEHPQWSTFAGSGSLRDQAVGGRSLDAGSLGPTAEKATTKRGVEPYAPNAGKVNRTIR